MALACNKTIELNSLCLSDNIRDNIFWISPVLVMVCGSKPLQCTLDISRPFFFWFRWKDTLTGELWGLVRESKVWPNSSLCNCCFVHNNVLSGRDISRVYSIMMTHFHLNRNKYSGNILVSQLRQNAHQMSSTNCRIFGSGFIMLSEQFMGLLPDTQNCGLQMRRECRERFPHHRALAIPTCVTARAFRTSRDACRDR